MRAILLLTAVVGLALPSRADDAPIDVSLDTIAYAKQAPPKITIRAARREVESLQLELEASDGRRISQRAGPLKAKDSHAFELPQAEGSVHYEGTLVVRERGGAELEYPLSFDTAVFEALLMTFPAEPLDEAGHAVRIRLNREAADVSVRALDLEGRLVGEGQRSFEKQAKESVFEIPWTPKSREAVAEVQIAAVDPHGFASNGRVVVWKLELPHEEVNFDTAKHDLKASERPKLDAVLPKIRAGLERGRRFADVQLWIAGHTDTVDDRAYNQGLSERRARTIARYFREKGVRVRIAYAGYGEDLLLVQTPDETPEVRNRRATYILSVTEPGTGVRWTNLP